MYDVRCGGYVIPDLDGVAPKNRAPGTLSNEVGSLPDGKGIIITLIKLRRHSAACEALL